MISMALIRIASRARQLLQRIVHSSSNAREVRRAKILLWLRGGERPIQVAKRTGLTRQAIYAIVQRFQARQGEPIATRIKDRKHPGRPPSKIASARRVMQELLQQSPRRYRYRSPVWTVPMLQVQVQRRLQNKISQRTIRRALHQLRYRFKRPRFVLALRPITWRQAKGAQKSPEKQAPDGDPVSRFNDFQPSASVARDVGADWTTSVCAHSRQPCPPVFDRGDEYSYG